MDLTDHPIALRTLGDLNYRVLLDLVAEQVETHEEWRSILDQARMVDGRLPGGEGNVDFFLSTEYDDFQFELGLLDSEVAVKAKNLLATAQHRAALRRLKEQDVAAYLDALRPVTEDELERAFKQGLIVNARDDDGDLCRIRNDEDYSGAFLETPVATAILSGDLLTDVVQRFAAHSGGRQANPQGLRLHRVLVRGWCNFNWIDADFPLGFEGCDFYGWVSADHARIPWLSFDSCDFTPRDHVMGGAGALNAANAELGDLRFWQCRGLGQLFLLDSKVGSFSPRGEGLDTEGEHVKNFRTVVDGAHFASLTVPDPEQGIFPFQLSKRVHIDKLDVPSDADMTPRETARRVFDWLMLASGRPNSAENADQHEPNETGDDARGSDKRYDAPAFPDPTVTDELEAALRRAGDSPAATEFGVLVADERAKTEGARGRLKRLLLKNTVRYFYDNLLALWWLIGLLVVAWVTVLVVSYAAPEQLVSSPLANPSVLPREWLDDAVNKTVWAFLYALDLVLSPLSLGQAQVVWPTSPWLSLLFAAYKGAGILLLGLFITGITGVTQRRSQG